MAHGYRVFLVCAPEIREPCATLIPAHSYPEVDL